MKQHTSPETILANTIGDLTFPGFSVKKLTSPELYKALASARLLDDRVAKPIWNEEERTSIMVQDEIAFNSEKLTAATYYIEKAENPGKYEQDVLGYKAAAITFLIAPAPYIEKQRCRKKVDGGVMLCDIQSILGKTPNYMILPGFTRVKNQYRDVFAQKGIFAVAKGIKKLYEMAPENTSIQISPKGRLFLDGNKTYNEILSLPVGSILSSEEFIAATGFPFAIDTFGITSPANSGTEKFAHFIGMKQAIGYAGSDSLGPLFFNEIE